MVGKIIAHLRLFVYVKRDIQGAHMYNLFTLFRVKMSLPSPIREENETNNDVSRIKAFLDFVKVILQ